MKTSPNYGIILTAQENNELHTKISQNVSNCNFGNDSYTLFPQEVLLYIEMCVVCLNNSVFSKLFIFPFAICSSLFEIAKGLKLPYEGY